jgi:hypothetical protein
MKIGDHIVFFEDHIVRNSIFFRNMHVFFILKAHNKQVIGLIFSLLYDYGQTIFFAINRTSKS